MADFQSFVVFADMRTGSNFLEANLNALEGVACLGEAFNPHFIGFPNRKTVAGVTKEDRDADPHILLHEITAKEGLNGFRFFSDHDLRVLDAILKDRSCAKIILTRNPAESYVSYKIAKATKQWKLNDVKRLRTGIVTFDADEFDAHIERLQSFQVRLLNALQTSGQTAFYLDYEDLQNLDVMNGLARFLGVPARLKALDDTFKKQNPGALSDKVDNPEEMVTAMARADRFNLTRTPNFEPRRGPMVPHYVAAPTSSVVFMPIPSGPTAAVETWLAGLDDQDTDALMRKFTQKTLRDWKKDRAGHRSFTVVRHPVARAHAAFCEAILPSDTRDFGELRAMLRQRFKLPLPARYPATEYDRPEHREAFLGFLKFVKANLSAQTSVRVDPRWATQAQIVEGFAEFATPDFILREADLEESLAIVAAQIGKTTMPKVSDQTDPRADQLHQIYDDEVEAAVQDVYQRDYTTFGFGPYIP